jgi:TonB family protein
MIKYGLLVILLMAGILSSCESRNVSGRQSFPTDLTKQDSILIARELSALDEEFLLKGEFAQPVGGINAIARKIIYPQEAIDDKIEGRVLLAVDIDESGSIDKIKVVRGVAGGCTLAAIQAVKDTRFTPATLNGTPVRSTTILPLDFRLK